jgi:hypothetical protein
VTFFGKMLKKMAKLMSLMLDYQTDVAYNQTAMGDSPGVYERSERAARRLD